MGGTLICAVTDGDESDDALAAAAALSERLGLRLVIACAVPVELPAEIGAAETACPTGRNGAERRVADLAALHGVSEWAELRVGFGDLAATIGQIAAEEAADAIVVGATLRGWRKRLDTQLADELESETPLPVLIAPRGARKSRYPLVQELRR